MGSYVSGPDPLLRIPFLRSYLKPEKNTKKSESLIDILREIFRKYTSRNPLSNDHNIDDNADILTFKY